MRVAHLFAGAGGGLLADLILGHQPVVAAELDPYCCDVLRDRAEDGWWPGLTVIEGDVRDVDWAPWRGRVDCIAAGFPCQDISAAGRGAGIDGERSGLYREVLRAIDAVRPGWVFLENSPRIRTRGRHVVIGELVARGYAWRDGALGATDLGAGHDRYRWWCVATNTHREGQPQPARRQRQGGRRHRHGAEAPADTLRHRLQIALQRGGLHPADADAIEAAARHTGALSWAPPDAGVCRVVDGLSPRVHRMRALGNAQVPIVAAAAWLMLTEGA